MSWISALYQTYENCYGKVEETTNEAGKIQKPLLPPFHSLQNSHIEVIINRNGDFVDAVFIENKNDQEIIIPCTEKSASRTSGEEPHPLCDKIQYCAKDYSGPKKSYFGSYFKLLEDWAEFDDKNVFLNAIFQYVKKGTLCFDILNTGKQFGKPNQELGDFLVRWKVEIPGEPESRCWKNQNLFASWQRFAETQENVRDICMITGKLEAIAINHPKRIRNSGDGAKIISANDKSGFTFLGRFLLSDFEKEKISVQAASIGQEVSQKAHSALRWLIDRQGFRNGDQVIVSWSVTGEEKPNEFSDSVSLFDESAEERIAELSTISYTDAGQTFAKKLSKKIAGYKVSLTDSKKIVVLGLDSAGPGRISITYYRELSGSEFLDRIEKWHTDMAWHFHEFILDPNVKKKKHSGYMVYAPAPRVIAEACYGKRLDDKLKKATIERLLPCIIDGRQLPYDLVNMAIKRASNRVGLENWEWERALSVACALYSCHIIRQKINHQENFKIMALEKQRTDRDYLYGRLLAVAEHIEERALYLAKENRETNAARMMHMFSEQPFKTWEKLYDRLSQGYFSRLQTRRPEFLFRMKNLIGEINCLFLPGEYEKNDRLSGLYLLGYHCQRLELVTNLKPEKETSEEVINK